MMEKLVNIIDYRYSSDMYSPKAVLLPMELGEADIAKYQSCLVSVVLPPRGDNPEVPGEAHRLNPEPPVVESNVDQTLEPEPEGPALEALV